MTFEITPLFLVLAGVIGLLIGLLAASLFSSRDARVTDEKVPPEEMVKKGFTKAATLWYSPSGKKIITEFDGAYYRDIRLLSMEQKNRILRLAEMLQTWTLEKEPLPAVPPSPGMSQIKPPAISPTPDFDLAGEPPKTEEKPQQPFEVDLISELKQNIEKEEYINKKEKPPLHPLSIAEQISLILDEMIAETPLKEKGIKLIENMDHGVDVWVGLEKFPGIDSVPDPDVQDLIRRAVGRWEKESSAEKKDDL